jgi:hypothetical protein
MSDAFNGEAPQGGARDDAVEASAVDDLRELFEANQSRVFYSKQLEVLHERKRFHWITNRALRQLVEDGVLVSEVRHLQSGGDVHLMWHRRYRYYRRAAAAVAGLIEEYAAPAVSAAVGLNGELLVLEGISKHRFVLAGRETRTHEGVVWPDTAHDLDFIFERDGVAYGVEVKNSLSYMDKGELDTKVAMCQHLGLRPLFVVRMMPRTWIHEVIGAGGFVLVLGYQLYPLGHKELARRVQEALGLPVDAPRALYEATTQRFVDWHERQLA